MGQVIAPDCRTQTGVGVIVTVGVGVGTGVSVGGTGVGGIEVRVIVLVGVYVGVGGSNATLQPAINPMASRKNEVLIVRTIGISAQSFSMEYNFFGSQFKVR